MAAAALPNLRQTVRPSVCVPTRPTSAQRMLGSSNMDSSSPAKHKQIIERCYRAICEGTWEVLDEAAAADYAYQDPAQPNVRTWPEHRAQMRGLSLAIPDLRFDIDDIIAEGDRVAVRWTMRGTHTGPALLMGLSATGVSVETQGLSLYHMVGGRVARAYTVSDMLGLMHQLRAKQK